MSDKTFIIFGATGRVGSAVARVALQSGTKIVLALRDPRKPVPGLSSDQERDAGVVRVQADLSDPASVAKAVRETGATRAFIYTLLGQSQDFMRATVTALKGAGIEFVVILGSGGVQGDIRSVPKTRFVPYIHAQVEVSLEEVFGPRGYVALRPGYFASNSLWWKSMMREGREVKVVYPETAMDWVVPDDIGRVGVGLLIAGPEAVPKGNGLRLFGPELLTFREAVQTIGRVVGKELQVIGLDEEEGVKWFVNDVGVPEPMARDLVGIFKARGESDREKPDDFYSASAMSESAATVQKYGGRRRATFREWVEEHRHEFEV